MATVINPQGFYRVLCHFMKPSAVVNRNHLVTCAVHDGYRAIDQG